MLFLVGGLFTRNKAPEQDPRSLKKQKVEKNAVERDAVITLFQNPVIPPEAKLAPETAVQLQRLVDTKEYFRAGKMVSNLLKGPAGSWRLHVDRSLGVYLFELRYRMVEETLLQDTPPKENFEHFLLGACVLALSKGRDYVTPDDVKMATIGLATAEDGLRSPDVLKVVDKVPIPAI